MCSIGGLVVFLAVGCGGNAGKSSDGGAGTSGAAGVAGMAGASGAGGMFGPMAGEASELPDAGQPDLGTPTPSGGTIKDGVCTPGNDASIEALGGKVEVLVEKKGLFFGPVAHSTGVYYSIEDDGLYRLPPGGTKPELIAATPGKRYTPWIEGDLLYYRISDVTTSDPSESIESLPLSDLKATPTKVLDVAPADYALDDTYLYAIDTDKHEVYREPRAGGARETLMTNSTAESLQVSNGYLYFVFSGDYVERIPVAGGPEEAVVDANAFDIGSYHLTDDGVYWTDYYGLYYTPKASPKEKTTIYGGETYFMTVAGDRVYWMHDSFPYKSVGWTKLDGSDCAHVLAGNMEANGFAVAADALYVTTFAIDNQLYRIPLD